MSDITTAPEQIETLADLLIDRTGIGLATEHVERCANTYSSIRNLGPVDIQDSHLACFLIQASKMEV